MVKTLEVALKRKSKKVIVYELEGKEPKDQGRIIQDIDDDPLVSLVRESMKEKLSDFVTPTKASGEAQEEEISPTILKAAKTLSKVASQGVSKAKSTDKGKRYRSLEKELKETKQTLGNVVLTLVKKVKTLEVALKRKSKKVIVSESEGEKPEDQGRIIQDIDDDPLVSLVRESMKEKARDIGGVQRCNGLKLNIGLDAEDEINTGRFEINTGIEDVNTGRKEKLRWLKRISRLLIRLKTYRQEEADGRGYKIDKSKDEEIAKQIHLDKMVAKRVQKEQKLSEQQLKRKAEVQEAAQFYTEEDMDTIRAKMEANTEKRKFYAEQKAKAKKSKPMTQAQQREYMSTFIKNQSSWKLSQLKKLSFEELKTEFEKLMKSIESFVPMETKARVKRHGLQLEQETSKKQKFDIEDASITKGKDEVVKEEEAEVPIGVKKYVVPTSIVVVPTGRYVVPAGKVIIIVSPGRLSLVPTGRVLSPGRVK
ncbi:hypothetical protein Tco_0841616 [Tanacetum coccineum]|uniref:Uncharacterized protein n=1 Tax=Tanacetum coccineum TaxID=301880 RepID=A0ABQ5B1A2_9ASTR